MTKLPAWHRNAPAPKPPKTKAARPAWAKNKAVEPDIVMLDGRAFDFKTLPPGTYDAKLTKAGAAKIVKGLEAKLDPKRCIAAGGRMRCLDCRCNLPSPKYSTTETMPDYGKASGHGKPKKEPARFRCIEDPSAGLLRMIGAKQRLMNGPQMIEDDGDE